MQRWPLCCSSWGCWAIRRLLNQRTQMKKLLLLAFVLVSAYQVQATQIFRGRFRPYRIDPACWAGGEIYWSGGGQTSVNPTGGLTYTLNNGDIFELGTTGSDVCCEQGKHIMGYTWTEVSTDGGVTWSLVSPTFLELDMPANVTDAIWSCNGGFIGQPYTIHSCPQP
jgi:hypothetical protein